MSRSVRRHNPFGRIAELFDASALGLVTLLLLGASFYATWQGMSDFVTSKDAGEGAGVAGLVVLVVLTLTLAMYVALRETVNPIRWRNIFIAFPLYALLALWSVGFGYGFWWSLVAGQDATEVALSRTVDSLSETTAELRAELAAGAALMTTAERLSDDKAARETSSGGTCGVSSPAGDGPLSRAREETRSQIEALSVSVQSDWLDPLNARLADLSAAELAGEVAGETADARKQRMVTLGRTVRSSAQDIAADATARGGGLALQLRAKAEQLSLAPVSGAVTYCYDPDLAKSLTIVADALEGPFDISVTEFRFAEGADGVAQAVEDLWLGLFARVGLVERDVTAGVRLEGRSLIALMATIGVDFALFVFALLRGGLRREYEEGPPPPTVIEHEGPVEGGGEAKPPLTAEPKRPALTGLPADKPVKSRPRVETNPKAVGIGSTDADSHSQIGDAEQVTDLIRSVDGLYRAMTKDEVIADKDEEIARLQEELNTLQRHGYVATGRPGDEFEGFLHKQVGTQPSDEPKGTIIATQRIGFRTQGYKSLREAEVIVSSGRNDPEE